MPIEGITGLRRAPRLGKVRLGIKALSKGGNEYPKAVDYFVVRADELATDEEMAAAFHKVYGPEPRELDIMFPSDDPEQFFPQFRKRYGSSRGLVCKGDGIKAHEVNKDTGELVEIPCQGKNCPYSLPNEKNQVACKPMASLFFLLPNVPGVGAWQMNTSSFHTIVQINSSLEMIARITEGKLGFIPLKLVRKAKEVSPDGKKKTVYVVDVSLRGVSLNKLFEARGADVVKVFLPPPTTADEPLDYDPAMPSEDEEEAPSVVEAQAIPVAPQTAPSAEVVEISPEFDAAGARERVAAKRAARVAETKPEPPKLLTPAEVTDLTKRLVAYGQKLAVPKDVLNSIIADWTRVPKVQGCEEPFKSAIKAAVPPKQASLDEEPEPQEEGR